MRRKLLTAGQWLAAIAIATIALVALTWFGTLSAVSTQRVTAEARIAAHVGSQAHLFEERLRRQLIEVDQMLRVLAREWQAQPARFDLLAWRKRLVLLQDLSPDLFIADETGVVRHHTVPEAVGMQVGDTDYFRHEQARTDGADAEPFISPVTLDTVVRRWHMKVARRLQREDGSFAGVIVAAVRASALSSYDRMGDLGTHGMLLVVNREQGQIGVGAGPNPIDPGTNIADTAMFQAMRAAPNGIWLGHSPLDGVERVHGFRRVPGLNLETVVAVDHAEAMQPTERWAMAAYAFAGGITLLLLLLAAALGHTVLTARRRETALARERSMLAAANTQLELAKSRADEKAAQLEATLTGMSDGVAMIDRQFRLLEWNPQFAAIAGVPNEFLRVGLPMQDILRAQAQAGQFGEVDIEADVARRMAALRGDGEGITERTRPDGRVIELRRNRLPDGGYVTVYADITAHKQTEATLRQNSALAEAAARAMSRFVAIVSHEIRTPLNALLNSLMLLADSMVQPTQQALLATARQSGDALAALLDDILEMSRMEAGQLALRPRAFALRPLIEHVLGMFGSQAAARGIALRLTVAGDVPPELYADPDRLRQVLINLLSNAVKFAAPGEVRVVAELAPSATIATLRLMVRDRGPVIADEERARLFQPFARLDQADSDGTRGTGLGLAICRHLVTLMTGEIGCGTWAVGGRQAGNEFWITLPLAQARAPSPADDDAMPRRIILPRTRVLLVEDIAANQLVTATLLRREGHLVDIAGDGAAALRRLQHMPYDLVLMDIFMPGMNGIEVARRIRGMTGPAATTPIIALTANVSDEERRLCIAAGMHDLLGKPVALTELLDALARHVWRFHRLGPLPDPIAEPPPLPAPVLSARRLAELRASLPAATLSGLVEECLADLVERLPALQQAVRERATDAVLAQSHAMAGMAGSYGMRALEERLRRLMQSIREAPQEADAAAAELEAEIGHAAAALREALHIEMV